MIDLYTNISAFSVLVAGIIGLIRFKTIGRSFYPFLFLIWLAALNEILSFILSSSGRYTPVNNNVYVLLEALLITHFFKWQGLFKQHVLVYYSIIALLVFSWCLEAVMVNLTSDLSYFRIIGSYVIILMSIITLNRLVVSGEPGLLKNPRFLIALSFLFYFLYKALVEPFYLYQLAPSGPLTTLVIMIHNANNLLSNLTFALALLWMPRKQPSILPY